MKQLDGLSPVQRLSEVTKKPMDSQRTDLALREIYETTYGIYDHANPDPQRPLALIGRNAVEDTATFSPLYRRIDEYVELKLFEMTGIPLDRMLQMPSEYVRRIIEKAKIELVKKGTVVDKTLNKLNKDIAESK